MIQNLILCTGEFAAASGTSEYHLGYRDHSADTENALNVHLLQDFNS